MLIIYKILIKRATSLRLKATGEAPEQISQTLLALNSCQA